eukprot:8965577-Pyramimonas_sp.AAC.1
MPKYKNRQGSVQRAWRGLVKSKRSLRFNRWPGPCLYQRADSRPRPRMRRRSFTISSRTSRRPPGRLLGAMR